MLPADIIISQLVNNGKLRRNLDYVRGVLGNCYQQSVQRKLRLEDVRIRIGCTGNGASPHYRIEFVNQEPVEMTAEQLAEKEGRGISLSYINQTITDTEYRGSNHEQYPFGFQRDSWSSAVEDVATLEKLRDRLKIDSRLHF